jgi:hypothetical protein
MTRSITVAPGQSMSEVLSALKIATGDDLVIEIPADASILLTANEFRALSIAAERDDVDVSIYTDDPLRRQLATLFGVPLVNEIPEPMPYQAPELDPIEETEPYEPVAEVEVEGDDDRVPRSRARNQGNGISIGKIAAALAGIAGVLAVVIGLYWFFFSSMTVELQLKRENVASTLAYQVTQPGVDPSVATGPGIVIHGQQVEFTVTRSLTLPATGQTIIPDAAASGEVVLRNPTDAAVTIEKGMTFTGFSGVAYAFADAVEVPAASNGEPGEANAKIQAVEGGEAGNADVGMLTGQLPNGIYYSNRLSGVTGGTQKIITTVSQADIDQLKSEIDREMLALAATTVLDQGLLLVPSTVEPVGGTGSATPGVDPYVFSQQVGDEATEVSVNATVTFTATAYDPTPLTDQAIPQLQSEVPGGATFDPSSVRVNTPAETGNANGVISLLATVTGEAVPVLDDATKDALAEQLAENSASANTQILNGLDYVESYTISYSPSWLPERVPGSADRITIETN